MLILRSHGKRKIFPEIRQLNRLKEKEKNKVARGGQERDRKENF